MEALLNNKPSSSTASATKTPAANDLTSNMIVFKADEKKYCFETNRANVTVIGSIGQHTHGSSKVKLKSFVDYKWEVRNYPGRLMAVHIDGKHIAYAIKVNNQLGRCEGMVRVVNPTTGHRALIKGMSSEVLDLQFAHLKGVILLACIEETALHIHRIDTVENQIVCTLLLRIEDTSYEASETFPVNSISWCPYVPEKESEIDEYVSRQIVWIRGPTFRCYSIRSVLDMYGKGINIGSSSVEGTLEHREAANVTQASFSPDGTTLCVSCEDGVIRFYQVYFHTTESRPRCLHQWIPHAGKPVTSFYFLDDLTKHSKDKSLWRHAITASDHNTEIKVWCCSTWECLQTIRFAPPIPNTDLQFNAQMDRTASYLILSDIKNRGLYVLQVQLDSGAAAEKNSEQDMNKSNKKSSLDVSNVSVKTDNGEITTKSNHNASEASSDRSVAYIKSVSEFPLSLPILSFGLVDAAVRKYKCAFNDSYLIDELEDYDEENHLLYCVVIHMFVVQPKSVQECHVLYQPTLTEDAEVRGSVTDEIKSGSGLSDTSSSTDVEPTPVVVTKDLPEIAASSEVRPVIEAEKSPLNLITSPKFKLLDISSPLVEPAEVPIVPKPTPAPINLMTPDSFQSPPGLSTPDGVSSEVRSTLRMLAQAQSPAEIKRQSAETVKLLNLVSSQINEEQEIHQKALLRQSAEMNSQILAPASGASLLAAAAAVASGGSSPSREVQEILSLKDSDLNEFYDESSDTGDDLGDESVGSKKNLNEQYNFNEATSKDQNDTGCKIASLANNSNPVVTPMATAKTTATTDWPKVPEVDIIGRSACMSNMHSENFNNIGSSAVVGNKDIKDISYKLDQVLELVQAQSCQISELQCAVDSKKTQVDMVARLDYSCKKIEDNFTKQNNAFLARLEHEHKKWLEIYAAQRDQQNRQFHDQFMQTVAQVMCGQLTERLAAVLLKDLNRNVVTTIGSKMDSIKAQIQNDVAQKLVSSDQLLRENIAKVCSNKNTMEVFGHSIVQGVQTSLQHVFTQSVSIALIPAYEKASSEMFKQIQDAFVNGTKSYSRLLDNFTAQYEPLRDHIQALALMIPEQLKASSEATLNGYANKLSLEMQRDMKAMQLHIMESVRENVKAEIRKGFEAQAATIEDSVLSAVRSQAQTPAPSTFEVQSQIKALLAQGNVNVAFHQALVANDLQLVEFTLEHADYSTVFNPCPLQQTVLLSLIQQIAADMSNHNELKQRYLSDSIINLNMRDSTTKEHAPKVLRELLHHCQKFAAANPNSPHMSGVRMLMMAVQGLGVSF